jgi:PPK2 family polyphosphate:nucleotide phosphotransferase
VGMAAQDTRAMRTTLAPMTDSTARLGDVAGADPIEGRRPATGEPAPAPATSSYRVDPDAPVSLAELDTSETEGFGSKKDVKDELAELRDKISDLQARLYAEGRRSLLVVLQAMDTGGKDGAIKDVFRGVNPQGCQVWSFKSPSSEELSHDFLWRYHQKAPPRGMITIFNRSHYEDVLVVRVKDIVPETVWRPRYEAIRDFEETLSREGVVVLKFFLHISKDEQKRRLEARLRKPEKHWKFSSADLAERARWESYQVAFQDAINATSTAGAPWYVVPSDHKWFRNLVIARTIAATLEQMDPQFPPSEAGLESIVVT